MKKFLLMSLALFGSMTAVAQTEQETTATEQPKCVLLASPQQFVDGGKYIIAAFNYNWGTTNPYDHLRFWKFEDNQHKFVKAANIGDVNSIIWTANRFTAKNTCTHARRMLLQLSHGDQYIKLSDEPDPKETPVATTSPAATTGNHTTDAGTIIEFLMETPPNTGQYYTPDEHTLGDSYFNIHFMLYNGVFMKALAVNGNAGTGSNSLGGTTLSNVQGKMLYRNDKSNLTNATTTFFYVWRVIETQADLVEHASKYLEGALADDDCYQSKTFGYYALPDKDAVEAFAARPATDAAVTQEEIDEYHNAIKRVFQKPAPGSYLKFVAQFTNFKNTAVLYYNTGTGTKVKPSGTDVALHRQNICTTHPGYPYNEQDAIVYYDNDNLLSYTTGYYLGIKESSLHWLQESDLTETGGNEGAPIYMTRGYDLTVPKVLQMNSVIGNTPVALHPDGSNSAYWFLNHQTFDGKDAEYAKTGVYNHSWNPWNVTLIDALPVMLGADGYGSFYAPIAVSFPEDVTVHAAKIDGNAITFSEVEAGTVIAPGTPVILKGTANATVNAAIHYDYDAAAPAALTETTDGISFYGKNVVEKLPESTDVYTFRPESGGNNTVTMTKVECGTCLPVHTMLVSLPTDCPLVSEDGNSVTLSLDQPNYTTGLREIEAAGARGETRIYDLQGRRLAAPVRGLNIIDGRKVLVK